MSLYIMVHDLPVLAQYIITCILMIIIIAEILFFIRFNKYTKGKK
jgi:hypothetical protein